MGKPGEDDSGCIPRLCADLFARIVEVRARQPAVLFKVEASYLEIYNEKVCACTVLCLVGRSNKSQRATRSL